MPVLVGLIDQLSEAQLDHAPDLPRQNRRQRNLQLDEFFEIGPAALGVPLAECPRDPVGVIGEQIRKLLEIEDLFQQLRDRGGLAVGQPVDLVDQDEEICPALFQLPRKLGAHVAQRGSVGEVLPERVETGCGSSPIAQPEVVAGSHPLAVSEDRLRQALQLFRRQAVSSFQARRERRRHFGKKSVDQAVWGIGQPRVEGDDDRRLARLSQLRDHVEGRRFAAAARPGKAEHEPGRPPIGFDQRIEKPSGEILAQQPIPSGAFQRTLDRLIHGKDGNHIGDAARSFIHKS